MVKLFQAMFMSYDASMIYFDGEEYHQCRAQASNLNEELGQVEYVFSDKTGTLTCNVMEFQKFSAGTKAYGTGEDCQPGTQQPNVNFVDPYLTNLLNNQIRDKEYESVRRVILFLACCHSIIIDHENSKYNAASPDELALVNAAKQLGFEFRDRDSDDNVVIYDSRQGTSLHYKLLNVCEFTSTRKRMSCIFRDPSGKLVLMCKGADSVIEERLSQESRESEVFRETQRIVR